MKEKTWFSICSNQKTKKVSISVWEINARIYAVEINCVHYLMLLPKHPITTVDEQRNRFKSIEIH